ncbi:MAG: AhpC/TSA family protein [Flavobacteriaceae bacterium]|nr:AhpC/TSA family protein [Flavobacteriaceae bacterium]
MKKLFTITFAAIAIISCKESVSEPTTTILAGKLANATEAKHMLLYDGNNEVVDSLSLDGGHFADTLSIPDGHYMLRLGRSRIADLYLEKGNALTIQADIKDKEALTISGKGASTNNYIQNKYRYLNDSLHSMGSQVYTLEEKAYKDKMLAVKTSLETILGAQDSLSATYLALEKRNLHFHYLQYINRYERYHSHYAKKPDFKASAQFADELKSVDYTNEADYQFSNNYKELVRNYYIKESMAVVEKDSTLDSDVAFLKALASSKSDIIKNHLAYESARYGITYTTDIESYFETFKKVATDSANIASIEDKYNRLLGLKAGNVSPSFENYENFAGGTSSLSDFKGKYVYIDVWATWCGPCLAEIPALKKLEEDYHDKNIAFLSISVDNKKDHDAWKQMVADRELSGVQLYADNSFDSDFIKDYLIVAIPKFILLDPEGNIIDANAKRPSDAKIRSTFDAML